jgi:hypothetical protein
MELQLVGWSYDEQVRGKQTYSVCSLTADTTAPFDKIAALLDINWRSRKIAFVEAVKARSTAPFTAEVVDAWVVLRSGGTGTPLVIRGKPGDPEITALLAAGFEYNE